MEQSTIQQAINKVAQNFGVAIKIVSQIEGPSTGLFEVAMLGKTRVKDVLALEEEFAIAIKAHSVRCTLMANRGTVGIEVATGRQEIVHFEFQNQPTMELPIFIGKDTTGSPVYKDLTKCPHLLAAGSTNSGKSVFINALIASLLHSVNPVQFLMIDPKRVELSIFAELSKKWFFPINGQTGPITEVTNAIEALTILCEEMENRYAMLQKIKARNIIEAKAKGVNMPYIVCVIDEFADLLMVGGKSIESKVVRLAQLARAVGIHLVVATQRPSSDIITGLIKANFPVRLAFKVASKVDSRIILDQSGAHILIGRGDCLWKSGVELERIQGCFLSTEEVDALVSKNGEIEAEIVEIKEEIEAEELVIEIAATEQDAIIQEAHIAIFHLKEYCKFHKQQFQINLSIIMRKLQIGQERAVKIATEIRTIVGI